MLVQKINLASADELPMHSEFVADQSAGYSPNLAELAYALRHPETWPESFIWDYDDCKGCAIGLTCHLWSLAAPREADAYVRLHLASQWFGMPFEAAMRVFFDVLPPWSRRRPFLDPQREHVAPEHVAKAIDRYLAAAHLCSIMYKPPPPVRSDGEINRLPS